MQPFQAAISRIHHLLIGTGSYARPLSDVRCSSALVLPRGILKKFDNEGEEDQRSCLGTLEVDISIPGADIGQSEVKRA